MKPASLPLYGAAATSFGDVLFAWWLLHAASQPAEGRDDALQRWENEGGNIQ